MTLARSRPAAHNSRHAAIPVARHAPRLSSPCHGAYAPQKASRAGPSGRRARGPARSLPGVVVLRGRDVRFVTPQRAGRGDGRCLLDGPSAAGPRAAGAMSGCSTCAAAARLLGSSLPSAHRGNRPAAAQRLPRGSASPPPGLRPLRHLPPGGGLVGGRFKHLCTLLLLLWASWRGSV